MNDKTNDTIVAKPGDAMAISTTSLKLLAIITAFAPVFANTFPISPCPQMNIVDNISRGKWHPYVLDGSSIVILPNPLKSQALSN